MDVILNPNSGPGTTPIDAGYVDTGGQSGLLIDLSDAGASIVGYVHTSWGQRDLNEVLAEIDRYFDAAYYRGAKVQLSGIFVDEMSNDLADLGYYMSLRQHVCERSEQAMVIGNPGLSSVVDSTHGAAGFTTEDYATLFDRLVTFEGHGITYRNAFASPVWTQQQPAERFAHIIHSDRSLEKAMLNIQLASSRNVATLYITDDLLPNPYDRLPTYWNELLAAIIPPISIDELTRAIHQGSSNHHYDVDQNGQVDEYDRWHWVKYVAQSTFGDANLDRQFNSTDLVQVFQAGQYEDGVAGNSLWSTGDWNGDGDFTSVDFIVAFVEGGYENATIPVPEPATPASTCGLCWRGSPSNLFGGPNDDVH